MKAVNYFCKKLHIRCLAGFWIRFSLFLLFMTDFVGNKAKGGISRKQSTPNFPKNEHFLPLDSSFCFITDDLTLYFKVTTITKYHHSSKSYFCQFHFGLARSRGFQLVPACYICFQLVSVCSPFKYVRNQILRFIYMKYLQNVRELCVEWSRFCEAILNHVFIFIFMTQRFDKWVSPQRFQSRVLLFNFNCRVRLIFFKSCCENLSFRNLILGE